MRVLRVYHAGRDRAHRARDRALVDAGADVTLVVPSTWPDPGAEEVLGAEPFDVVELPVARPGDVNRHRWSGDLRRVVEAVAPDLVDVHEEPVSAACRQWLAAAGDRPVVGYTAQNVDKRFPPPFHRFEQAALRRLDGLYPCSRQAASVARGKGFAGPVEVLPLGLDLSALGPGLPRDGGEAVLGLVGRLVPEKGVLDALEVLGHVARRRPARLVVVGEGPLAEGLPGRAAVRGLTVEQHPWRSAEEVADAYRRTDVLLVPSRATATWVEQFGRVVVEAQACGAVVAGYASGAVAEAGGPAAALVPEGDVDALARVVEGLLDDPAERDRRRDEGLSRAASLSWAAVASGQLSLYERATAAHRQPPAPVAARAAARRRAAEAEFGPPARLAGGAARPFALPVLREDRPATRLLGRGLDLLER